MPGKMVRPTVLESALRRKLRLFTLIHCCYLYEFNWRRRVNIENPRATDINWATRDGDVNGEHGAFQRDGQILVLF
jgi:hypothetical protein